MLTVIDKVKLVQCKTLLIHGKKDTVVPFKHALVYNILYIYIYRSYIQY